MILSGAVSVMGKPATKPSLDVPEDAVIELSGPVMPYVGRGGYKLEAALDLFGVDPSGLTCIDIGASTGGFTDCLLMRGAAHVTAVDAGSGQLAPSLRANPRVTNIENCNARYMDAQTVGGRVALAVCDVSFISLTHIFEAVTQVLLPYDDTCGVGCFISLIKPQFEAGREAIGKNGIVRDPKTHLRVVSEVIRHGASHGLYCMSCAPSPIMGGDGNREFLAIFAHGDPTRADISLSDPAVLRQRLKL